MFIIRYLFSVHCSLGVWTLSLPYLYTFICFSRFQWFIKFPLRLTDQSSECANRKWMKKEKTIHLLDSSVRTAASQVWKKMLSVTTGWCRQMTDWASNSNRYLFFCIRNSKIRARAEKHWMSISDPILTPHSRICTRWRSVCAPFDACEGKRISSRAVARECVR